MANPTTAYSSSLGIKGPGVLHLPPEWDASQLQGYPSAFHQTSLKIHQYQFILLDRERH